MSAIADSNDTREKLTDFCHYCREICVINIRTKVTTFLERLLKLIKVVKGEVIDSSYQNEEWAIIILIRQNFDHKLGFKFNLKCVELRVRDNFLFNPSRLQKLIKGENVRYHLF